MASASATQPKSADDIRREMAQIRREMHQDMQGVVAGAEAVADWRHYVRLYPWAALGVAVAVGYLIVPRRRTSATRAANKAAEAAGERVEEVVKSVRGKAPAAPAGEAKVEKEKKKSGIVGMLFGMLAPIAVRAAQSYAANFVESYLAQQPGFGPAAMPATGGPGPDPNPNAGRPEPRWG